MKKLTHFKSAQLKKSKTTCDLKKLNILIENFPLPHIFRNSSQKMKLLLAAKYGHLEMIEILLKINPKIINATDESNSNALHIAAKGNHVTAAKFILNIDPDLADKLDNYQETPLHIAAKCGYENMIALLFDSTSSLSAKLDAYAKLLLNSFDKDMNHFEIFHRIEPKLALENVVPILLAHEKKFLQKAKHIMKQYCGFLAHHLRVTDIVKIIFSYEIDSATILKLKEDSLPSAFVKAKVVNGKRKIDDLIKNVAKVVKLDITTSSLFDLAQNDNNYCENNFDLLAKLIHQDDEIMPLGTMYCEVL